MGTLQREPGKRLISRGGAKGTDRWSSQGRQTEVSCWCCLRNRPQNPKPEKSIVWPHLLHLGSLDKLPAKQSPPSLCSWHFKKHSFQELHFQMVVALLSHHAMGTSSCPQGPPWNAALNKPTSKDKIWWAFSVEASQALDSILRQILKSDNEACGSPSYVVWDEKKNRRKFV